MNRNILVALAFGFIILAAMGANYISGLKTPADVKPEVQSLKMVKSRLVQNESLNAEIEITGRLMAKKKVELFSEVTGTFLPNRGRFKEGNYFEKGATLVSIDHEEQSLNLLAQKSALMNQITLMLPDLKADYTESFPAWEQYLQQMDIQAPLKELPTAVNNQEKYFISAKNLYNLFYTIQSQEKRLEKYTISAPFSGNVAESMIDEGTLVRAGQKIGTFINSYSYELEAAVNGEDIELIKVGSQVNLYAENESGSWKGTVSRISKIVDPNTQTIKVFINTSGKGLREGMYLSAKIAGRKIDEAVRIDRSLLLAQDQIYIVQDSSLKLLDVEPIIYTTQEVIVKGVPSGTHILNESVIGAYEGLKVGTY